MTIYNKFTTASHTYQVRCDLVLWAFTHGSRTL